MNTKELVMRARQAVGRSGKECYKLFLIHTGAAVAATLVVALIQYLLQSQILASSGLAEMGTRSVLQTAQMVLSYVLAVAMPLWEAGVLVVALRIFRGERAQLPELAEGLHRFGPMLRTMLLEFGVYMGAAIGCSYGASLLYAMTPMAMKTMEKMEPWMDSITTQEEMLALMQDPEFSQLLLQDMWPAVVLSAVASLGAMVFLFYMMRFMRYLVLDGNMGAFRALKTSAKMTSRNKWALAKLDLHFWWYYGLQLLITAVVYTPELCALAGVTLPVDAPTLYWLSYGIYAAAQIALLTLARPQVEVAFAGVYDSRKAVQ